MNSNHTGMLNTKMSLLANVQKFKGVALVKDLRKAAVAIAHSGTQAGVSDPFTVDSGFTIARCR